MNEIEVHRTILYHSWSQTETTEYKVNGELVQWCVSLDGLLYVLENEFKFNNIIIKYFENGKPKK